MNIIGPSPSQELFYTRLQQDPPPSGASELPALRQPPLSECAYFAKRPFSWARWSSDIVAHSEQGFLDRNNLEPLHEHILFKGSGENLGFGPQGLFDERTASYPYRIASVCFDGSRLRRAIVGLLGSLRPYNLFANNCQDFADAVRREYDALGSVTDLRAGSN